MPSGLYASLFDAFLVYSIYTSATEGRNSHLHAGKNQYNPYTHCAIKIIPIDS